MNKTVRIKKERHFRPHAEFYHAASVHLHHVSANYAGSYYSILSSLMMTAFAFEAYMNFAGPKVEPGWEDFDRASTVGKFRHVATKIGYVIDFTKRPHSTVRVLFGFRNRMAHPRDERLTEEYFSTPEHYSKEFHDMPNPKWLSLVKESKARECYDDVGAIVIAINRLLPAPESSPLVIDGGSGTASAVTRNA